MKSLMALGQLELEADKPEAALIPLRKAVALEPDQQRARLDYGSALAESDRPREAIRQFKAVQRLNAHEDRALHASVENYIQQLQTELRGRIEYSLSLIYDDNVNIGPNRDVIELFDLPFTLTEDSRPQDDLALQFKVGVDRELPLNDWKIRVSANASHTLHFDQNDFDFTFFDFSIGPTWDDLMFLGRAAAATTDLHIYGSWLNSDLYYTTASLRGSHQTVLSPGWVLNNQLMLELSDNDQFSGRSGGTYRLQSGLDHYLTPRTKLTPKISYAVDDADEAIFASSQFGLGFAALHSFTGGTSLYSELSYRNIAFDEREAANDATRDDDQLVFIANVSRPLPWKGTHGSLGFTRIDNSSNIGFSDYDRNRFAIQAFKRF